MLSLIGLSVCEEQVEWLNWIDLEDPSQFLIIIICKLDTHWFFGLEPNYDAKYWIGTQTSATLEGLSCTCKSL